MPRNLLLDYPCRRAGGFYCNLGKVGIYAAHSAWDDVGNSGHLSGVEGLYPVVLCWSDFSDALSKEVFDGEGGFLSLTICVSGFFSASSKLRVRQRS